MRIGVEATCWHNPRGYGRHARAMLTELVRVDRSNRYTLLVDSAEAWPTLPPEADIRLVPLGARTVDAASAQGRRSMSDLLRMSRALSHPSFDMLLFPTVYSYTPVVTRARKVVFIHDVIAETFPHLTLPRITGRLLWQLKVRLGCWQADAIATVSDYSRQGIAERYGIDPLRIAVVGEAPDPIFRVVDQPRLTPRLTELGIDGQQRAVVYVGGFGPHKNLEALVSVFAALARQHAFADVRLVLVGQVREEAFHTTIGELQHQVKRLGLADRVVFTGYLPDEELVI